MNRSDSDWIYLTCSGFSAPATSRRYAQIVSRGTGWPWEAGL